MPGVLPPILAALTLGAALAAQQPNLPQASLRFNGVDGPPWPIAGVALPIGVVSNAVVGGAPGAPFLVVAAANLLGSGLPFAGGRVDVDPLSLAVVLDGFTDPSFVTGAAGDLVLPVAIGPGTSNGSGAAFQAAVRDFGSPFGVTLSAATSVVVVPGITTSTLSLGNDDFVEIDLAPFGLNLVYYDRSYSRFFVGANGFLSFEYGSNDFSPTQLEMLAWMPRVCGLWTDLVPPSGGTVGVTIDQSTPAAFVEVAFQNVVESAGIPHTFTLRVYAPPVSDIVIGIGLFNNAGLISSLVGISPGWNRSTAGPRDLSALNSAPWIGAPLEAVYEGFGPPAPQAGFVNPWDLPGKTITFSASNAGTASASYVVATSP